MNTYFASFLEANQISQVQSDLEEYGKDRTKMHAPDPSIILFPKTTEHVSKILSYCNNNNISVVPSGGRTGLSGAAMAPNKEVVISLSKMNSIASVDSIGSLIEVEAGAILESIQAEVAKNGLYFPLDFASKGTAQIGGCISTNAGGVKVIKYGMTRDIVLGLEVVLMSGEILDLNKKLIKDNSGYNLIQPFIGSEGTLGVITKATLKCVPKPSNPQVALFACESFEQIPEILKEVRTAGYDLAAFEFFTSSGKDAVISHINSISYPFEEEYEFFTLIEICASKDDDMIDLMEILAEKELIIDGTTAENSSEVENLWGLRENISESVSMMGNVHKNDISVPVSKLIEFVTKLEKLVNTKYSQYHLVLFGHIGDGNIHVNIIDKEDRNISDFKKETHILDQEMFELIRSLNGSISAEHGIGLLKKEGLKYRRTELEISLMKQIKAVFDPKNLLNPGKIF
jgi:glycolate oxidase subunit GlcD